METLPCPWTSPGDREDSSRKWSRGRAPAPAGLHLPAAAPPRAEAPRELRRGRREEGHRGRRDYGSRHTPRQDHGSRRALRRAPPPWPPQRSQAGPRATAAPRPGLRCSWPRPPPGPRPPRSAGAARAPQVSGVGDRHVFGDQEVLQDPFWGIGGVCRGLGPFGSGRGSAGRLGVVYGGVKGVCSAGPLSSRSGGGGLYGFSLGVRGEFAIFMGPFGGGGGSAGVGVPFGGIGSVGPQGLLWWGALPVCGTPVFLSGERDCVCDSLVVFGEWRALQVPFGSRGCFSGYLVPFVWGVPCGIPGSIHG